MIVAKTNDNAGAETEREPGPAGPSALIIEALGEHAAMFRLAQNDGELEIDFAVRAILALRDGLVLHGGEIAGLKRQLGAQRGATTKAKTKIVELEEAGKPRAIGVMEGFDGFTADDLMTAIDSAEEIVLAFSDGTAELKGIRPRAVRAEAFKLTRGRVQFTDAPLEVTGPGDAETVSTTLVGVGLLLDGEQAAWSPMSMPISIGAGQTFNLAGSVIFG